MIATAVSHSSPVLSRRRALQSLSAIGAMALTSVGVDAGHGEDYSDLDRLIAIYEANEQTHGDLLDLEEVYSLVEFAEKPAAMRKLHADISGAIDNADEALIAVFRHVPANTNEAFAKARWVFDYKASINGNWRDCEIEALICSSTGGWLER